MDSLDSRVLRTLHHWREDNVTAALVTVLRTWGSSPRPVGSLMAMRDDGTIVGSVSGGCIEDDLIDCYRKVQKISGVRVVTYGVGADDAYRFGLPCGGTVELAIEFNPEAELLKKLLDAMARGELTRRQVHLRTGQVCLTPINTPEAFSRSDLMMSGVFGPVYRMLIIGAGQLSEYLATMAIFNGFAVTVCDPRTEYSQLWSVRGVQVLTGMPDDVVNEIKPDLHTCVVALTHDPRLDDMALLSALYSDAFYVGVIGSRRNNAARRRRMIEYLEMPEPLLHKLRGPVGIFIGSKTPAEIAVSIMAEVIAVKNGVSLAVSNEVAHAKRQLELVG